MTDADEKFLCERNDEIDNAAWQAILKVHSEPSGNCSKSRHSSWYSAVRTFLDLLTTNEYYPTDDVCIEMHGFISDFLSDTGSGLPKEYDADSWHMYAIGGVVSHAEAVLSQNGLSVCYPWLNDDEVICYKTCDKCTHCKR